MTDTLRIHMYVYIPSNGPTDGIQGFLAITGFWDPQPIKSIKIKKPYQKPGFPPMTPLSPFGYDRERSIASRSL